jgi:hypothetical protein
MAPQVGSALGEILIPAELLVDLKAHRRSSF